MAENIKRANNPRLLNTRVGNPILLGNKYSYVFNVNIASTNFQFLAQTSEANKREFSRSVYSQLSNKELKGQGLYKKIEL